MYRTVAILAYGWKKLEIGLELFYVEITKGFKAQQHDAASSPFQFQGRLYFREEQAVWSSIQYKYLRPLQLLWEAIQKRNTLEYFESSSCRIYPSNTTLLLGCPGETETEKKAPSLCIWNIRDQWLFPRHPHCGIETRARKQRSVVASPMDIWKNGPGWFRQSEQLPKKSRKQSSQGL